MPMPCCQVDVALALCSLLVPLVVVIVVDVEIAAQQLCATSRTAIPPRKIATWYVGESQGRGQGLLSEVRRKKPNRHAT